jgi:hypothetical protein
VLNRLGDGAPDRNAHVIVHAADGTAIADGPVDNDGRFSAEAPPGRFVVTVVRTSLDTPTELTSELTSVTGVAAGEDLTFGLERRVALQEGGTTTMTSTYTNAAGSIGTTFYTSCLPNGRSGVGGTVSLEFRDGCRGNAFQLLAVSVGLAKPRFVALNAVPYVSGSSFGTGVLSEPMSPFVATHSNVPPALTRLATHRRTLVDGVAVATFSSAVTDVPPGTVALEVLYPVAPFLRAEVVGSLDSTLSGTFMQHEVRTPNVQAGIAIDWNELALPWIDNVKPVKTGVTWTTTIAGGAGDAMFTSWRGTWNPGRPVTVTWRTIGPRTDNALVLPRLPPAFAELDPQAFGGEPTHTVGSAQVVFMDYEGFDSYDDIRLHPDNYLSGTLDAETVFGGVGFTRRTASRGDR